MNTTVVARTYPGDREWADRYLPTMKTIIGRYLLDVSPDRMDREQAADLVILRGRDMTIGCRVRQPGYSQKFPGQFTIRASRSSGARTEFEKIKRGWGDWFFYGHALDLESPVIDPWWLIDLSAFRYHLIDSISRKRIKCGVQPNIDKTTTFMWFDVASFPEDPPLLVASSSPSVGRRNEPIEHTADRVAG